MDIAEHMENVRRDAETKVCQEIEKVNREHRYSPRMTQAVVRHRL